MNAPQRLLIDIAAWTCETTALSTLESGAFLKLKMYFWRRGPLPDRDTTLATICGLSPSEWKQARKALEPLFSVSYGEWVHPNWADELEQAYEAIRTKSAQGKAAATRRWSKNKTSESDAGGMRAAYGGQCGPNAKVYRADSVSENQPQPPLAKTKKFLNTNPDDGFEEAVLLAEASFGVQS
jgi:uncharacterized protein YdaU (DUF1376 family)